MSILPTAAEGIRRAEDKALRAAERLARLPLGDDAAPQDSVDLSAETVALLQASIQHAASVKVAETAADLDRKTLDILG